MNRQYFSKKQIENDELKDFIHLLIKHSWGKSEEYNDIHIQPDDFGVTVEWTQAPWSREWGGHWQYINDDEVVMKYYEFPDESTGLFNSKEEYEDALKEWLEEHKDEQWEINSFGRWYSKKNKKNGNKN